MNDLLKISLLLSFCFAPLTYTPDVFAHSCPKPSRQPATDQLIELVNSDSDLKKDLMQSIAMGQRVNANPHTNPVATLADYYDFVDSLVTYNPQNIDTGRFKGKIRIGMDGANYCNWNILDILSYSHFLIDRQITNDPHGQIQFSNSAFSDWMRSLAEQWGKYLETRPSAIHIPEFEKDPNFGDWYCPAKPYATFQDFFTRELCRKEGYFPNGSRPIQGYVDPLTVVSIGDSNAAGWWPISGDGKLVSTYDTASQSGRLIKGQLYNDVHEFITGSANDTIIREFGSIDPNRFNGGTWTHQFLNVNDYHILHTPVAGKIVYVKHIKGGVRMKSGWKPPLSPDDVGHYNPEDTEDWQFGQTRLVIGIETADHGIVIISPMGMAQVAGIVLRDWVELGAIAKKGWEFGNFAFGGSDFVVIFEQQAEFVLTVPTEPDSGGASGINYRQSLQGEKYGCFGGIENCSDVEGTVPRSPPVH